MKNKGELIVEIISLYDEIEILRAKLDSATCMTDESHKPCIGADVEVSQLSSIFEKVGRESVYNDTTRYRLYHVGIGRDENGLLIADSFEKWIERCNITAPDWMSKREFINEFKGRLSADYAELVDKAKSEYFLKEQEAEDAE